MGMVVIMCVVSYKKLDNASFLIKILYLLLLNNFLPPLHINVWNWWGKVMSGQVPVLNWVPCTENILCSTKHHAMNTYMGAEV